MSCKVFHKVQASVCTCNVFVWSNLNPPLMLLGTVKLKKAEKVLDDGISGGSRPVYKVGTTGYESCSSSH